MQADVRSGRYPSMAALAGGLVLLVLLAACGAAGGSEPALTPTATPPAPTPTPTPTPTPVVDASRALPLERFHYAAFLTLRERRPEGDIRRVVIATEGDFQAPDRHSFTHTLRLGDQTIKRSAVVIGDRVWFRRGDRRWLEVTPDNPQLNDVLAVAFSPIRPGFLGGPRYRELETSVIGLRSKQGQLHGIPTEHYRVTAAGQEFFEALLAEETLIRDVDDFSWDLWLAQDGGWPVRLRSSATLVSDVGVLQQLELKAPVRWVLRVDITRPNDPTLAVRVPRQRN